MTQQRYVGDELEVFANANNWKLYYATHLAPFLRGDVLEVGAGLGGTTPWIRSKEAKSWTSLEPDPLLAEQAKERYRRAFPENPPDVVTGTLDDVRAGQQFDAIAYIDVLEHIEDDRAELIRAERRLKAGGHLVVLSPAHPALYSEFDRHIGHYRRYTRQSLGTVVPADLKCVKSVYLDSTGALLSLGNRLLLRSSHPTPAQIAAWDNYIVPISRRVDPILKWTVGKTIVGIWRKN